MLKKEKLSIKQIKQKDEIKKESFKSIESDWINFKWVDINELDNYKIHPSNVKELTKNCDSINHLVEIVSQKKIR